jgi:N-methylhydantoinase B
MEMATTQHLTLGDRRLKDLTDAEFEDLYHCDRFTATVLGSKFRYIIKHMCTHLMTNAFSVILRDWYDFAATLSGPPQLGYPMAAISDSLVIFAGPMSEAVRNSVEEFGPENLRPGDVLMSNDPYRTGTHPNDILFARPIFHEGELVAILNIQPHMMDVGGTVPAGFGSGKANVYENGLTIPPMLLYRDDKPIKSTFALLFDNARFGEVMLPDMLSIAADLRLGERLLIEAIERYGLPAYFGALRYATDVSAESMREAIAAAPDGVYVGTDLIDCDAVDASEEYLVKATVTIKGSRVEVDLSGSSRQARTCINCGWLDSKTAVATALKFLLDPKSHFTSGVFRHVDLVLPPGAICNALPPDGAIMLYWETASAVVIAVFRALAEALGENAIAGDFASAMVHNGNGLRDNGQPWATMAVCGGELGPWGATRHGDAENSLAISLANSIAPAVESTETDTPVVMLRKEYAMDTSGAGIHRGGAATMKDTLWLTKGDHYPNVIHAKKAPGFGVNGGGTGTSGGVWTWPGGAGKTADFVGIDVETFAAATPVAGVLDPKTNMLDPENGEFIHYGRTPVWKIEPGGVLRFQTNAGGGWGDPLERPVEKVLADVRNQYTSHQAAKDVYGVVVLGDPDVDPEGMTVDEAATTAQREQLRASR